MLAHFSISQDGKKVVFVTEQGQVRSGIRVGWLDRAQPLRQLTFGGEYRASFGKPGQIVYQSTQPLPKIMKINEDGSGEAAASDLDIMQLQGVSPDGRWAVVGVTPPGGHGDRNAIVEVVPLEGGAPIVACDTCSLRVWCHTLLGPVSLVEFGREMAARSPAALSVRFIKDCGDTRQVRRRASHLYEGLRQ